MQVYVFSSKNQTNIWAGIGAQLWAVPPSERMKRSLETKVRGVRIGSPGLIYCAETKTLTTPFLISSKPDPDVFITDVWPETWAFPFRIHPLGTPRRQMTTSEAKASLTVVREHTSGNFSHALQLSPVQVFVPVEMPPEDWEQIVSSLT